MTTLATGPAVLTTAQKMKRIERELQHELIERDDEVEAAVTALCARTNAIAYGLPGLGKTLLFDLLARRINGKYVRVLMDRQMDKSELIGMFDLPHYEKTGEYTRNITDTILDAHVVCFEEVGKTGPAATTPTLMAINEHKGRPGGKEIDIPMISGFGTTNEELEPGQEAFGDRFTIKLAFQAIQTPEGFMALLRSAITPRAVAHPTTVTPDELMLAINHEVPAVTVPEGVMEALFALRNELAAEQVEPTDRTFFNCIRILQARAWLDSRDTVEEDDIAILRHVLWSRLDQRQKVGKAVMAHTGPVTRLAIELMTAINEASAEMEKLHIAKESNDVRSSAAGRIQHQIGLMHKKVDKLRAECVAKGRGTSRLDEVDEALTELHVQVFMQGMNMPEVGARRAVAAI